MTANVLIIENGDTPFIPGELIRLSLIRELHKSFTELSQTNKIRAPRYKPTLMSTTNSSLLKDGFLSAAGFQETKRMLSKAAVEGTTDWLRGLKESVIIGRVIPAGSSFLNYKSYLDNIYLFKYKN
jgi:DNA-directed RNA polymerase subunit beta'